MHNMEKLRFESFKFLLARCLLVLLACANCMSLLAKSAQTYQCQSEGFHVDPNDCGKFIRCVDHSQSGGHLSAYFFSCPAGKFKTRPI